MEHPDGFDHGDKADETRIFFCQPAFDNGRRLTRLNGVILREVAH